MIEQLKNKAIEANIPIVEEEGFALIAQLISANKYLNILEIGSAIGYSAIKMALLSESIYIDTIELDLERYNWALSNINNFELNQQITIFNADALLFDINKLDKKYDLIFIDAAKAQYQKFFEKYVILLNDDGCIIVDNINFHGMANGLVTPKNRNTRQLVGKINRFTNWIYNNEYFMVDKHEIGDGMLVIRKRK